MALRNLRQQWFKMKMSSQTGPLSDGAWLSRRSRSLDHRDLRPWRRRAVAGGDRVTAPALGGSARQSAYRAAACARFQPVSDLSPVHSFPHQISFRGGGKTGAVETIVAIGFPSFAISSGLVRQAGQALVPVHFRRGFRLPTAACVRGCRVDGLVSCWPDGRFSYASYALGIKCCCPAVRPRM
jgi:hypothetical protein